MKKLVWWKILFNFLSLFCHVSHVIICVVALRYLGGRLHTVLVTDISNIIQGQQGKDLLTVILIFLSIIVFKSGCKAIDRVFTKKYRFWSTQ